MFPKFTQTLSLSLFALFFFISIEVNDSNSWYVNGKSKRVSRAS